MLSVEIAQACSVMALTALVAQTGCKTLPNAMCSDKGIAAAAQCMVQMGPADRYDATCCLSEAARSALFSITSLRLCCTSLLSSGLLDENGMRASLTSRTKSTSLSRSCTSCRGVSALWLVRLLGTGSTCTQRVDSLSLLLIFREYLELSNCTCHMATKPADLGGHAVGVILVQSRALCVVGGRWRKMASSVGIVDCRLCLRTGRSRKLQLQPPKSRLNLVQAELTCTAETAAFPVGSGAITS